jgi:hypothetical protein
MSDARKLFVGDTLATHCAIAALARELLLQNGSEAFIRAEQRAKNFVTSINLEDPILDQEVRAHALLTVAEMFGLADGAQDSAS